MSTNPFNTFSNKKKKKSVFDTTEDNPFNVDSNGFNSFEQKLNSLSPDNVNVPSTGMGIDRTAELFKPKVADGFISVQKTETPYVPKELHPSDLVSMGLNASTRFMDSMATKGYSLWDVLTPFTLDKLREKGPVTFIKDIGSSIGDVGTEVKQIATNALGSPTSIKDLADYAKIPEEQFSTLPQQVQNQIMQSYDKENKPQQLTSYDLISKYHPDFVRDHPIAAHVMSFVGDVALDPTTYIGFESALPRMAGSKLTREGITAVRELNELAEVGFRATIENKQLTHIIDFGPSEVRQLRYVEDTLGTAEAQKVLENHLSSYGTVKDIAPLTAVQRQESVENTFLRLARNDAGLIQAEGLGVFVRIPVVGEFPIIKPEVINKIFDTIGVTKLRESITRNLAGTPIEAVRYAFQRDYKLPEEYLVARRTLEGQLNLADHQVIATAERFAKLPKDSRFKLTELASRIDESILTKIENKRQGFKENIINVMPEVEPSVQSGFTRLYRGEAGKFGKEIPKSSGTYKVFVDQFPAEYKGQWFYKSRHDAEGYTHSYKDLKYVDVPTPQLEAYNVKNVDPILSAKTYSGIDEYLVPSLEKLEIKNVQLTDKQINAIRQYHMNDALRNGKINPEEFDIFSRFVAHQNQFAQIELESKLYNQAAQNSINREKGVFFKQSMRTKAFGEGLTEEELAKGFVPENDLAVLHALTMKTTLYQQAKDHFNMAIKSIYGSLDNVPKAVQNDLDYIGHTFFAQNTESMLKPLVDLYDNGLSKWKTLAYPVKPSVGGRQLITNTLQSFAVIGPRAFNVLDPRNIITAMILMADKSAYSKFVPKFLLDGIEKYGTIPGKVMYATNRMEPQLLDKMSFRNRLGERIDGPAYMQEFINNDIYHKGSQVIDLDTAHNLKLDIGKANGFVEWQKEKWHDGFWTFFKESIPWINVPERIETLNKIALYHNARMIGYLPKEAKEITTKGLFDYAHGLSSAERTYAKRLVPFYTFQRFAIPLVASLIKEPGRAVTLKKITESFFEVWQDIAGGKKLTEQQRQVLPGLLLEQPSVFEGIDTTDPNNKQTGIFRTFNNFTFTDMLSLVKTKVDGSIDVGGTVQKATLAQVTPVIKMPLEYLYDRNFFTNAPLGLRDKSVMAGKISSGDKVKWFEDNVPDLIKHSIGYEVKTDIVTGKQTGYINPYLSYLMSAFVPAINDYVRISRDDLNAHEFAMQYFGGVGTTKLDFEQARRGKEYEWKSKIKELQLEMRRHYVTGRSDVINDDQAKLQELIKSINKIQNLDLQTPK